MHVQLNLPSILVTGWTAYVEVEHLNLMQGAFTVNKERAAKAQKVVVAVNGNVNGPKARASSCQ
jgi:hypothetical protein